VAEKILQEIPSVKTFSTLSPVPGFNKWLDALPGSPALEALEDKKGKIAQSLKVLMKEGEWSKRLSKGWTPALARAEEKTALMYLCFIYLTQFVHKSSGDSVAKFHLANGAKLHDINWAADLSKKGFAQSSAMMVNYLYELNAVEDNHEKFVKKEVVFSRALSSL